jgi:hypothetical protein
MQVKTPMPESKQKTGFWSSLFGGGPSTVAKPEAIKWPARARLMRTQMKTQKDQ